MVTGPGSDGKPRDIVVFSITKDAICDECGEELWSGNLLRVVEGTAHCMACADLGHLVYLPSGDAAARRGFPADVSAKNRGCRGFWRNLASVPPCSTLQTRQSAGLRAVLTLRAEAPPLMPGPWSEVGSESRAYAL
jgi:hypothetical protein